MRRRWQIKANTLRKVWKQNSNPDEVLRSFANSAVAAAATPAARSCSVGPSRPDSLADNSPASSITQRSTVVLSIHFVKKKKIVQIVVIVYKYIHPTLQAMISTRTDTIKQNITISSNNLFRSSVATVFPWGQACFTLTTGR